MSTILELKKRKTRASITLDMPQLRAILSMSTPTAKDRLHDLISNLLDSADPVIHDKRWLEQIVNFVGVDKEGRPQRVPLTEQAKWIKLATRITELDDTKEGPFTLSTYQETILWERLSSDEFTVMGMPQAFAAFISDFLEVSGRRFAEMEPEKSELQDGPGD